jgi:predicted SnoaL-like aldol condensation-catalyzing enzyme
MTARGNPVMLSVLQRRLSFAGPRASPPDERMLPAMVFDMLSRRGILRRLGSAGAAAVATTIAPSVARAQDATPTVDLEANKVLARRFHDEIFEQGNLAAADEILTPDFTWRGPPNSADPLIGPEAIKQTATEVRAYFSNSMLTDDDEIAEGDRVVIRWTLTGAVQTETGSVPVVYTGIDIFRIADGKLAELWQNTDDLGLEQQLAAASAAATPTS